MNAAVMIVITATLADLALRLVEDVVPVDGHDDVTHVDLGPAGATMDRSAIMNGVAMNSAATNGATASRSNGHNHEGRGTAMAGAARL